MSKAFVKDADPEQGNSPERPISPHPNLVTAEGLSAIEMEIARLDRQHAGVPSDDTVGQERIARELRYWTARRDSAQLQPEPADHKTVHFGSAVTIKRDDEREQTYRIVGEDEADPAKGSISYVAPLARAVMGKQVGDEVTANDVVAEIVTIA